MASTDPQDLPNLVRTTERDPAVIAAHLAEVDPALLLASLVHLTGDHGLIARYAPAFTPLALRTGRVAHQVDPTAAEEIRAAVATALAAGEEPALLMPDLGRFKEMAELVVGEP